MNMEDILYKNIIKAAIAVGFCTFICIAASALIESFQ